MRGFEADVQQLLASFASQHGDAASFEAFKGVWCAARCGTRTLCRADTRCRRRRSNSFSLIHEARPQALSDAHYTQALYGAAVALLGRNERAAAAGVDANDAGVLYCLLLLFCTQHCTPRVHVYLPVGALANAARGALLGH
jgi:hypothetical protein